MIALFLSAFITLFVVIDPPGCAPIFAGLTAGYAPERARGSAIRACIIASLILLVFALFGQKLLDGLHVGLDAFRIAGGLMLFLIALDMVFEKRTQRRETRAEKVKTEPVHEDIAVFPMAMPMIAGPGSIATVMLLMARAQSWTESGMILAALLAVMALMLVSLIAAGPLMRLLGPHVEGVITRVLGVLLAALAVQYVIDGVKGALGH
jgi:multiple antibiotic resistance protein